MCINCNNDGIPYTESDLRLEYLNETGLSPDSYHNKYQEWLEQKIIDQRNQENNVCKANDEIQKILHNELNDNE